MAAAQVPGGTATFVGRTVSTQFPGELRCDPDRIGRHRGPVVTNPEWRGQETRSHASGLPASHSVPSLDAFPARGWECAVSFPKRVSGICQFDRSSQPAHVNGIPYL